MVGKVLGVIAGHIQLIWILSGLPNAQAATVIIVASIVVAVVVAAAWQIAGTVAGRPTIARCLVEVIVVQIESGHKRITQRAHRRRGGCRATTRAGSAANAAMMTLALALQAAQIVARLHHRYVWYGRHKELLRIQ